MTTEAERIKAILDQCQGTESYRFNPITKMMNMVYTDGVYMMAHECEAHWLIDAIASFQPKAMKDAMLRDFQSWTLRVHEDNTATLICERDTNDEAFRQVFDTTDFPLPELQIWLEPGQTSFGDGIQKRVMVAMLPSER